jgi:CheY-like chemotaxis protein
MSKHPSQTLPPILIIEDSQEDFETLQRLLQKFATQIPLQRCINGDQALAYLYHAGRYTDPVDAPRPGLIVLDLNLPGTDGREVLRRIKQNETTQKIPVVVFSTSNDPRDMEECYQYGVNRYIVKPINFQQLKQDVQTLIQYWSDVTHIDP